MDGPVFLAHPVLLLPKINIFNIQLIQLTAIAMVSGLSGEADFMIFFQFAGQQKLFTNNRLGDKNQEHYNELKLYSQVNFFFYQIEPSLWI